MKKERGRNPPLDFMMKYFIGFVIGVVAVLAAILFLRDGENDLQTMRDE